MINIKKILPIIIIVAIAAGAYFLFGKKGGGVGNARSFATLKAAVDLGIPMKCTYKVEGYEYEGYIKGEKWRGKVKSADGNIGEVIMKDNCMWSWTTETEQGVKMCFEEAEGEEDVWSQQDTTPDIDYNCLPTAITDSRFDPPGNINFLDMDQMIQQQGL